VGFWNKLVNVGLGMGGSLKGLLNEDPEFEDNQTLLGETVLNGNSFSLPMGAEPGVKQISEIHKINETIYDNKPALGSVVYYQIDEIEHSGIFVGDDMFIHLNSERKIEKVSLTDFTCKLNLDEIDLWFPCNNENGQGLGLCTAVYIALEIIDNSENYHLDLRNSQQFISGCITNSFDNTDYSISRLKQAFAERFECQVVWKCWER
jgi:hypothetical protein